MCTTTKSQLQTLIVHSVIFNPGSKKQKKKERNSGHVNMLHHNIALVSIGDLSLALKKIDQ